MHAAQACCPAALAYLPTPHAMQLLAWALPWNLPAWHAWHFDPCVPSHPSPTRQHVDGAESLPSLHTTGILPRVLRLWLRLARL